MKKNLVLGLLLLALLGISAVVILRTSPGVKSTRPLEKVDQASISKFIIDEPNRSVTLEKKEGAWVVTAPIHDPASAEAVDELMGTLAGVTITTQISENKEKYPNFELEDGKATHLRVFVEGKEDPVMDGFVGKQAVSYGTTYFRYAGKDPVYIADNLPNWVLLKPVDEYRQKKLLPLKKDEIVSFEFALNGMQESFSKSSSTWTRKTTGAVAEEKFVRALLEVFDAMSSNQFESPAPGQNWGFEKPYLTVTLKTAVGSSSAVVGNKKKAKKGEAESNQRYARTEGRDTILFVDNSAFDTLLNLLKINPK